MSVFIKISSYEELVQHVNESIVEFGGYSFYDEGPEEVCNMWLIMSYFSNLSIPDQASTINRLADEEHGCPIITTIFERTQELPDVWFNELYSLISDEAKDHFA